jgi:hypothetical protein
MCLYDGESFIPKVQRLADKHYVVGETYPLIVHEERSTNSHRHYFAAIHDAWMNLPEDIAVEFATSEHLRKWALIKAGYCDRRSIVCASKAEAVRFGAFMKPMDEFAVITVTEATVTVYTAQSQSMKAMGKADFQASKTAVLDIVSAMVGVKPAQLGKAA